MKPSRLSLAAMHIMGWVLFQSLPLVFLAEQGHGLSAIFSSWKYWEFCAYFIAVFYLHSCFLLPHLFHRKKLALYTAGMIVLLASVIFVRPFEQLMEVTRAQGPPPGLTGNAAALRIQAPPGIHPHGNGHFMGRRHTMPVDILSIVLFLMTVTVSVAIDVTRRWRQSVQRAARAEADKANAELSFLKAQINPHFLFNTLNNVYSMAVTGNGNTADTIMKLSNIMRYVTDDVNEDYVSLQSEVDCIIDYVDLQKLRLGKKVSLDFSVEGDPADRKIAPLVLMTFIENVFKYGTSNHEQSTLFIKLIITPGRIDFICRNKLFMPGKKIERTGIGITNTRKRLEHLYPGRHTLDIIREDGSFTVELTLYD